jgi:hypothetical protein
MTAGGCSSSCEASFGTAKHHFFARGPALLAIVESEERKRSVSCRDFRVWDVISLLPSVCHMFLGLVQRESSQQMAA